MKNKSVMLFIIITLYNLAAVKSATLIVEAFASTTPMTEEGVYNRAYGNIISIDQSISNAYFSVRVGISTGNEFAMGLGDYTIERSGLPTIGPVFFTGLLFNSDSPSYAAWNNAGNKFKPNSGSIFNTVLNAFTVTNLEIPFFPINEIGEEGTVTWNFTGHENSGPDLSGSDFASIHFTPEPSRVILSIIGFITVIFQRRRPPKWRSFILKDCDRFPVGSLI